MVQVPAEHLQCSVPVLGDSLISIVCHCPEAAPQAAVFDTEARHCTLQLLSRRPQMFNCSLSLEGGEMIVKVQIKNQSTFNNCLLSLISSTAQRTCLMRTCKVRNARTCGVLMLISQAECCRMLAFSFFPLMCADEAVFKFSVQLLRLPSGHALHFLLCRN